MKRGSEAVTDNAEVDGIGGEPAVKRQRESSTEMDRNMKNRGG